MDKQLHIVSHDVPWPADYGGVIDIFYTLKALQAQGVQIHLHCFTSGKRPQDELNAYCSSVNYYERKKNISAFSNRLPLIVYSRSNDQLIRNLQKDDHPILLEGIHCSYYLQQEMLKNRKVAVRLFNTEFEYYTQLAQNENNLFKKWYYRHEARLLKNYEKALAPKASFFALSQQDVDTYRKTFNATDIHFVPPLLPFTNVTSAEGNGSYCLYHGNLAINENENAVCWLLEHVFNKIEIPFVIAGKNPGSRLQKLAHKHKHTCLVANPSDKEMQDMIAKAHVHVLPSFNKTGIKLKLLNAFFSGRHCLVNMAGVLGSGLENYCHIADTGDSFKQKIAALYSLPFTKEEIEQRQQLLQTVFNNEINARELMKFLW
ncbi:MAG: glycosyltransferase [Chitinophagaceae bacterium]|nr:glycosyltransferase [Chitinophagaceae bacterium]